MGEVHRGHSQQCHGAGEVYGSRDKIYRVLQSGRLYGQGDPSERRVCFTGCGLSGSPGQGRLQWRVGEAYCGDS